MDKKENNFNKKYTLFLKYAKIDFELSILFNTHNTYTAYHIDQRTYHKLQNKYSMNICFNMRKSNFCSTFLDLNDYRDDGCNIQNNFNGIYTQYKDILYVDSQESIILDKVYINNGFVSDKLDISILKLQKYPDEFFFCICNRQSINKNNKKRTVRSSSFCINDRSVARYLGTLYKKYKNADQLMECEDAINSLFDTNKQMTPQQIQNGFIL